MDDVSLKERTWGKGVFVDAKNRTARVFYLDPDRYTLAERLHCLYTGSRKRRIGGLRFLLTYSADAQVEPNRILSFDDRTNGVFGDFIITDFDEHDEACGIRESDIDMVLSELEKNHGKTIEKEVFV